MRRLAIAFVYVEGRMGELLISGILGLLPLLGIAYMALTSNGITVDALFMSLILLTISGIFFLNIALELLAARKAAQALGGSRIAGRSPGTYIESGVVETVAFYETEVGRPDKSLVTLRPANGGATSTKAFNGGLRKAFPPGE